MATPPTFTAGAVLTAAQMNQLGLFLVKSQTVGAGVGSVLITDCFNADFRNYRVVFEGGVQSVNDNALQLQFAATAGHYASMRYDAYSGVGSSTLPSFNQTFAYFGLSGQANQCTFSIDVYAPNLPEVTKYSGTFTSNNFFGTGGGVYFNSAQLTAFTIIFPGFTNTGGTVKVYGYRN
jgi:hypothetical protein